MAEERYLQGGQEFTDYNQAVAAKRIVDAQIAAGGSALLRAVQPGGTPTPEAIAQIAQVDANVAAANAAATVNAVAPSDHTFLIALGGLAAVAWFFLRRR